MRILAFTLNFSNLFRVWLCSKTYIKFTLCFVNQLLMISQWNNNNLLSWMVWNIITLFSPIKLFYFLGLIYNKWLWIHWIPISLTCFEWWTNSKNDCEFACLYEDISSDGLEAFWIILEVLHWTTIILLISKIVEGKPITNAGLDTRVSPSELQLHVILKSVTQKENLSSITIRS